ncbi:unnamed protein product [Clonostachys rosea]|uniref:Carboxylic ester hydrolase n=1 Tax=Bionectria ochroleuca TaxID=29856 RepID=A0ABY6USZ1_BIOOC|nr:unnamed protein product [Clonostachys rosea]
MAPVTNPGYEPVSPLEPEPHSLSRERGPDGPSKGGSQVAEMLPSPADSVHGEKQELKLGKMERLEETWTWEALALAWALLCLAAVVIVLAFISGKPVSSWRVPIGPNALIGVFSALAKAALMTAVPACISQLKWIHFSQSPRRLVDMQAYDDASRGPFGSLLFLHGLAFGGRRTVRSKASTLAAVGCLITIVALALEPFTQQIVSFRIREVELGNGQGTADLAVATGYDTGAATKTGTWRPEVADEDMQGAILAGLFSRAIDTSAYEQCSTSNCSWPVASSLSVCSSCQDVTASSTKNCTDNKMGWNVQDLTCNYTTPAKNKLQAKKGPASSASYYTTWVDTATGPGNSNPSNGGPAVIGTVSILKTGDPANSTVYKDIYNAHIDECNFYWCKTTYTENKVFANGLRVSETTRELLNWDQSVGLSNQPLVSAIDEGNKTSYPINLIDSIGVNRMLASFFSTSLVDQDYQSPLQTEFSIARLLYNTNNISRLIEFTASSMSARLRSGSSRKAASVRGTVMHTETYIHGCVSGMERIAVEKTALCDDFIKERRHGDAESNHELRRRFS